MLFESIEGLNKLVAVGVPQDKDVLSPEGLHTLVEQKASDLVQVGVCVG